MAGNITVEIPKDEGGWKFRRGRGSRSAFFSYSSSQGYDGWLLLLICLLVYLPHLGNRVVRTAGDDKVYVSQAVEMAERGSWFLQTLANEPNYYKGPLHYILLRIGMLFFGDSMWATVYMNLILVMMGAYCVGMIVHRNMRNFPGWAFFAGLAFALNAGIYSHVFASQMEVETASLMAVGLYLLDRAGPGRGDLQFWLLAGFTGWLKSPLHSVFLGVTAILFWAWSRELWPRMKNLSAWAAAVAGVALCSLGYAPAFLFDRENFVNAYVLRETLWKPANGAPWTYPVIPLFTYYLFPWMLPAFVAFADGLTRPFRKRQRPIQSTPGSRRVVALGLALVIPSVAFFLWHPYRGQNYNLPIIGGLLLVITSLWASRAPTWDGFYKFSLATTACLILVAVSAITFFTRHFDPMPFWWSSWTLPILWIGFFLTARGIWREGVTFGMVRPDSLARRSLWVFLALGTLTTTLGEREMIDLRDRIYRSRKEGKEIKVVYYNLQRNIWSEWGYLNFMIPYRVRGIFNEAQLKESAANGDLVLVPGDEFLAEMHARLDSAYPPGQWEVEPWRRWKTKGKNAQGVPAWKEAWETRDLTKLEKNFYMVRIKSPGP